MFKRMMLLGAVASAMAFAGCQDRSRQDQGIGGAGDTTQQSAPATGGSGNVDSTLPGSSNTIGGTRQDNQPGVDLGGTGATGGSGAVNDQGSSGSMDQGGTGGAGSMDQSGSLDQNNNIGGSGSMNDQDTSGSLDHGGTGTVHDRSSGSLDQGGTGGSGAVDQSGSLDQNGSLDQSGTGGSGMNDDLSGTGGSGKKTGKHTGTMGGADAGTGGSDAGTK